MWARLVLRQAKMVTDWSGARAPSSSTYASQLATTRLCKPMFVGADAAANLLEIGVVGTSDGPISIHAMPARPKYLR